MIKKKNTTNMIKINSFNKFVSFLIDLFNDFNIFE